MELVHVLLAGLVVAACGNSWGLQLLRSTQSLPKIRTIDDVIDTASSNGPRSYRSLQSSSEDSHIYGGGDDDSFFSSEDNDDDKMERYDDDTVFSSDDIDRTPEPTTQTNPIQPPIDSPPSSPMPPAVDTGAPIFPLTNNPSWTTSNHSSSQPTSRPSRGPSNTPSTTLSTLPSAFPTQPPTRPVPTNSPSQYSSLPPTMKASVSPTASVTPTFSRVPTVPPSCIECDDIGFAMLPDSPPDDHVGTMSERKHPLDQSTAEGRLVLAAKILGSVALLLVIATALLVVQRGRRPLRQNYLSVYE